MIVAMPRKAIEDRRIAYHCYRKRVIRDQFERAKRRYHMLLKEAREFGVVDEDGNLR